LREEVFKPFLRLDDARNQDEGGTGLGLAIARDIARSHGGDIMLSDSPPGGLRATGRVPIQSIPSFYWVGDRRRSMIRLALRSAQAQNLPGMEILRGARLEGAGRPPGSRRRAR